MTKLLIALALDLSKVKSQGQQKWLCFIAVTKILNNMKFKVQFICSLNEIATSKMLTSKCKTHRWSGRYTGRQSTNR